MSEHRGTATVEKFDIEVDALNRHWPSVEDPGLVCKCGRWSAEGVKWKYARLLWWRHVLTAAGADADAGG